MTVATDALGTLTADAERYVPDQMSGNIELEHRHRYQFASQLIAGKAVLDIACGEGYGSAMLARHAGHVTGVDISPAAVRHACRKYQARNLAYATGSCAAIPLSDASVEAVVSFETIEHHDRHEQMLQEIRRVLRPEGLLVISSPDKLEYTDKPGYRNPYHVKELYKEEFRALLAGRFAHVALLGQRVAHGSVLLVDGQTGPFWCRWSGNEPDAPDRLRPMYWIALASDAPLPTVRGSLYERDAPAVEEMASRPNITRLIFAVAGRDSRALRACLFEDWYRERNPDVFAAGEDPYQHWMKHGAGEGRLPCGDPLALLETLMQERMTDSAGMTRGAAPHGQG